MSGTVICGVDDSREARVAARVAGDLAARLDLRLVLVNVVDDSRLTPPPGRVPRLPPSHLDEHRAELEERGLATVAAVAADAGVSAEAEQRVVFGQPSEGLVGEAQAGGAQFIVIGSRGVGGVRSALLGSTSSSVLREADRPVVVVPHEASHGLHAP